jgi:hypothetical protein
MSRATRRRATTNPYTTDANPYMVEPAPRGTPADEQMGLPDDMGDGFVPPPEEEQLMSEGKVALKCMACGQQGEVALSTLAKVGSGGRALTCRCGSTDLDVDENPPRRKAKKARRRTAARSQDEVINQIIRWWGGANTQRRDNADGSVDFVAIAGDGVRESATIYPPGVPAPMRGDSGRPIGDATYDDYVVKPHGAAPDDWFTVSPEGIKDGWSGPVDIFAPTPPSPANPFEASRQAKRAERLLARSAGTQRTAALRYELVDSHHPDWRGMRFSDLERARKELERSHPPGRFFLKDRQTGERIATRQSLPTWTQGTGNTSTASNGSNLNITWREGRRRTATAPGPFWEPVTREWFYGDPVDGWERRPYAPVSTRDGVWGIVNLDTNEVVANGLFMRTRTDAETTADRWNREPFKAPDTSGGNDWEGILDKQGGAQRMAAAEYERSGYRLYVINGTLYNGLGPWEWAIYDGNDEKVAQGAANDPQQAKVEGRAALDGLADNQPVPADPNQMPLFAKIKAKVLATNPGLSPVMAEQVARKTAAKLASVSDRSVECRKCKAEFAVGGEPPFWCDGCDEEVSSDQMQEVGWPSTAKRGRTQGRRRR